MPATVHVLHGQPSEIGSFLHVAHTGHRKLEALVSASRLRFRRFVFDAAHVDGQQDLLATLQRAGCEIVLDPNTAETAAVARYNSSVSRFHGVGDLHSSPTSASRSSAARFRGQDRGSQSAVG
jgi:hypothetical protein